MEEITEGYYLARVGDGLTVVKVEKEHGRKGFIVLAVGDESEWSLSFTKLIKRLDLEELAKCT